MKERTTMTTVLVNGKRQDHVREGLVRVITGSIEFPSRGNADIIRITDEVREHVAASGVGNGTVTVFAPGATGAVTTIEYEPGVVADLDRALEQVAPRRTPYRHHARWGDDNGSAHVRAGLVGPSLTVPFQSGRLLLGQWQQIVILEFDTQPRQREYVIQIVGE